MSTKRRKGKKPAKKPGQPLTGAQRRRKEQDIIMANARTKAGPEPTSNSRAPSIVREHRKEREKPYRTEFKKAGTAKKKKINYRVCSPSFPHACVPPDTYPSTQSTYQHAPRGYTFLPLGTNDLAERCKELSRQRNFPVQVVDVRQPYPQHGLASSVLCHRERGELLTSFTG